MRLLFVSSEIFPLAKTGGLADVGEALPRALKSLDVDVRVMMPGYPQALQQAPDARIVATLPDGIVGEGARILEARLPGTNVPVWLFDSPTYFRRDGSLYQDKDGIDWPDNAERFAAFCHAVTTAVRGLPGVDWRPDLVHANDWHTGLVPLILKMGGGDVPPTLFTIHNICFQGNYSPEVLPRLGLSWDAFNPDGLEFYGQVSFLKAGLKYSDQLTTVSGTYAREILTPEFGFGLDGVLRERKKDLVGILNGVDYSIWDPKHDTCLPASYSTQKIAGKKLCKAELQQSLNLPGSEDTPILAFISRLTHQKMADTLLECLPWILDHDVQFVLLANGDRRLELAFEEAAQGNSEKAVVKIGYEEDLAHRIQAGADMLLAPARFEPCGLAHLYALRFGTIPIVRRTGGLKDTVVDADRKTIAAKRATGFIFNEPTPDDMIDCIERALELYREPLTWRRIQRTAMGKDYSWSRSAK